MKKGKFYTIFIVSENASRVTKFKVPRLPARTGIIISVVLAIMFAGFIVDYINTKSKMFLVRSLKKENQVLREQMAELAGKTKSIDSELRAVKQMEAKVRIMLNAENHETVTTNFGIGGPSNEPDDLSILYSAPDTTVAYNKINSKLDNLNESLKKQEAGLVEVYELMQERNAILVSTPSIWPTRGWITSGFGYRVYPFTGETKFHEGIDISTRIGTNVIATADGIVTDAGYDITYGNNIIVDHGFGFVTRYGHLSKIDVKPGNVVKRGQKIGEVGNTGFSTGPHLHYEIRINGVPVNPENYILN